MKFKHIVLIVFLTFLNNFKAQNLFEIKGNITDETTNEPLIGATVSYASGKGVVTDVEGNFVMKLENGAYALKISYIGYTPISKAIKVNGKDQSVNFKLLSATELTEVEIVADVAKIRETPVAVSNISAKQIQEELGARDLPMLLNSTPGVYASAAGGGAGDARVNIRGFDQRNVAVLVDGVPVNDMESGQVYWSNWSGLSEVTKNMQVQRGLGASRLALPSVGGTMNIITANIDEKRFIVVKKDYATNNYERYAIGFNSGIINNKFGVTMAGSYTKGDGWVTQTSQTTWSYFAKLSYRINQRNLLVFGVNGAPQSHAQKNTQIGMAYYDKTFAEKQGVNVDSVYNAPTNKYSNSTIQDRGLQYNVDWGTVNGNVVNTKVNYFHKPLFNLSYFLTINPKLTYSNVLYVSIGRGGGTFISNPPNIDRNGDGQLLLQKIYDANSTAPPNFFIPGMRGTSNYIYTQVNNHNWVGTLSTLKYQINKKFHFTGGFDARYYNGIHYHTPYNLLGADYVQQPSNKDLSLQPFTKDPMSYVKYKGDKINIYYQSKVTWLGLFTQLEYKSEKISAFLTLTGNQSSMQNINYFGKKDVILGKNNIIHNALGYGDTLYTDGTNYGVTTNPNGIAGANGIVNNSDGSITFKDNISKEFVTINKNYNTYNNTSKESRTNTSEVKYYYGYTVKGGANYKITDNHNLFVNIGYMSLTPRYNNVFDRSGIELKDIKNQKVLSAELGYGVKYQRIAANLNGYITNWGNKPLDFPLTYTDKDGNPYYFNVPGIDAVLKGVELDFSYSATKWLKVEGFGMLADWKWNSSGTAYVFTDGGTPLDTIRFDATNLHIGNSPQQQVGGSLRFEPVKGFYIKAQYTLFNKMYAQFNPAEYKKDKTTGGTDYRTNRVEPWKMPSYGLVDLFAGYTFKLEKVTLNINASINNLLNTVYVTDASFANGTKPTEYNATNALVYMGQGRRGNLGLKITF